MFVRLFTATALVLATSVAGAAQQTSGDRFALLVGISAYGAPHGNDAVLPLEGPKNDVTLIHHTLTAFGVPADHIRVVADSLNVADYEPHLVADGPPTRAEILSGIDWLIERARPGDQVMVFISGHGAYVPESGDEARRDEPDGLDEIVLPIDVGVWVPGDERVENQVLDDEFSDRLSVLIDNGVFLWFVVDTCHSGTAVRSGGVSRRVDPVAALGVPADALQAAVSSARRSGGEAEAPIRRPSLDVAAAPAGRFVAFYAAQPDQEALEMLLPRGLPRDQQRHHGLLTWHVVQALRSGDAPTYEAVARRVLAGYWEWGGQAPTPMFDGDLAGLPIVGGGGDRTWGLEVRDGALLLRGGLLDDIGADSVFAIHQRNAGQAEPVFYARVVETGVENARLEILQSIAERPSRLSETLAAEGLNLQLLDVWLDDRAPTFEARQVERVPVFTLRIAGPDARWQDDPDPALQRAYAVIRELNAAPDGTLPLSVQVVGLDAEADLRLDIADGRLWFRPPDMPLVTDGPSQAYSLPLEQVDVQMVAEALRTIARARNLGRVADAHAETPIAQDLVVDVRLWPGTPMADGTCPRPPPEEPSTAPDEAVPLSEIGYSPLDFVIVNHCDRVYLTLTNTGDSVLDLTPLYIGPWSQIYFLDGFDGAVFGGLRLMPGESRVLSYTESTRSPADGPTTPVGFGRVVILAVEGDPARPFAADFRHLAGRLPEGDRRDAGAPSALRTLLDEAAFGVVRSGSGGRVSSAGAFTLFFETTAPGPG